MPIRLIALIAALLLVAPAVAAAGVTRTEVALLREMNTVRAENGLAPLRFDGHLQRAARSHTRDMLASNFFAHGAFAHRMLRFDVKGRAAGENLAWGTGERGTAPSIISAWLASPEHRANLLRPMFTRVGIGDLVGTFLGADGAHVVTADFAGG